MKINIDLIKQQLFANPEIRSRILRDYGIKKQPFNAHELGMFVVGMFDQEPSPQPLQESVNNAQVFRAAVKSLGSNSRAWATFLNSEPKLRKLLHDYDPIRSSLDFSQHKLTLEQIKACLPGQSSSADASAIKQWADLLSGEENYYAYIQDLGRVFQRLYIEYYDKQLNDLHLLLCLVGYLAYPPLRWPGARFLSAQTKLSRFYLRKLPGMGYPLASEFMRNLHWNGFKPDRHIQRLFNRWFPDQTTVESDVRQLQVLIGRNDRNLNTYLAYSLIGIAAAPQNVALSQVDNFVWLLGAYIERKGRESEKNYLIEN